LIKLKSLPYWRLFFLFIIQEKTLHLTQGLFADGRAIKPGTDLISSVLPNIFGMICGSRHEISATGVLPAISVKADTMNRTPFAA